MRPNSRIPKLSTYAAYTYVAAGATHHSGPLPPAVKEILHRVQTSFDKGLTSACKISDIESIKYLMRGATLEEKNQGLIISCAKGCIEATQLLIDQKADYHTAKDEPLCQALSRQHGDIVKLLVDKGVDVMANNMRIFYFLLCIDDEELFRSMKSPVPDDVLRQGALEFADRCTRFSNVSGFRFFYSKIENLEERSDLLAGSLATSSKLGASRMLQTIFEFDRELDQEMRLKIDEIERAITENAFFKKGSNSTKLTDYLSERLGNTA